MFLLLAFLASTTASITNCNTGSVFTITKLAANPPDTVVAGQNVSWTLLYTSPSTVTGGTASSGITFNGIPFTPTVTDLCESIVCPLAAGAHDGSTSFADISVDCHEGHVGGCGRQPAPLHLIQCQDRHSEVEVYGSVD